MIDAECSIALPYLTLGVNRSALPHPHPPDRYRILSIDRQRVTGRQIVDDQDQAVIARGRGSIKGQRYILTHGFPWRPHRRRSPVSAGQSVPLCSFAVLIIQQLQRHHGHRRRGSMIRCCAPVYLHGQTFAWSKRHVGGDAGRRRVSFEDCLFDHNA